MTQKKIDWTKPIEANDHYSVRYLGTLEGRKSFSHVVVLRRNEGDSEVLSMSDDYGKVSYDTCVRNVPNRVITYQTVRQGRVGCRIYLGSVPYDSLPWGCQGFVGSEVLTSVPVIGCLKVTSEDGKVVSIEFVPYNGQRH